MKRWNRLKLSRSGPKEAHNYWQWPYYFWKFVKSALDGRDHFDTVYLGELLIHSESTISSNYEVGN